MNPVAVIPGAEKGHDLGMNGALFPDPATIPQARKICLKLKMYLRELFEVQQPSKRYPNLRMSSAQSSATALRAASV